MAYTLNGMNFKRKSQRKLGKGIKGGKKQVNSQEIHPHSEPASTHTNRKLRKK